MLNTAAVPLRYFTIFRFSCLAIEQALQRDLDSTKRGTATPSHAASVCCTLLKQSHAIVRGRRNFCSRLLYFCNVYGDLLCARKFCGVLTVFDGWDQSRISRYRYATRRSSSRHSRPSVSLRPGPRL